MSELIAALQDDPLTFAEKQELLVTIRRRVYAAMETGNPGVARTLLIELREIDMQASFTLRADIVKDYGVDI